MSKTIIPDRSRAVHPEPGRLRSPLTAAELRRVSLETIARARIVGGV